MKKALMLFLAGLMLMVFAGSTLAGTEGTYNTFYGISAGSKNTGQYNSFIGYAAGHANTGNYNNFIGYAAGHNTTSDCNNFFGHLAGQVNTTGFRNTFLGHAAGSTNTTGYDNTFIGSQAGYFNTTGFNNIFIGGNAGVATTEGFGNTFIGYAAGSSTTIASSNVFLGNLSGYSDITGNWNTFIGYQTGYSNITGFGNVFLGYNSGYNETGSNKLYIANNDGTITPPLIYGEFDNNILSTPGSFGIGTKTPVRQLHLVGDNAVFRIDRTMNTAAFLMVRTDGSGTPQQTFVVGTNYDATNGGSFVINDLGSAVSGGGTNRLIIDKNGTVTVKQLVQTSSIAQKDNVRTYENALETVNKLRGVRFDWKDSGKPSVGLIAEEVEQVVPEVVAHNDGNATGVNYASLVGVLVEAVKEQQKTISDYQKLFDEQQQINSAHSQKILELERLLSSK